MLSLTIPLLMVVAFLLLTLAVGLYFSRKTTTLREYAVGNKQFATVTLVATVLATNFGGGGLVRTVQQVHATGLYYIIFFLFSALNFWVISHLTIRMGPFMQNLSMPDTIGRAYGKHPRIISALSSICTSIAITAIQINVMSQAIYMCIDFVSPQYITILATLMLIGYSTFGGIRGVTFTDVLQFITFSIIIPLLAVWMFYQINKPVAEIIPFLKTQEKFQPSTIFHFDKLVAILAFFLSNLVSSIDPLMMQRVYMSSDPIQAQKVFLYSGLFALLIKFAIILIGLFVFIGAPNIPITEIWGYIMGHVPPFFKGLLSISLLAMAMSTADSCLNSCSIMVSHDMLESVRGVKAAPYAHPLRLARLTSLVVGLLAMMLAFYRNDLLNLLKLTFAFSVPIITAPFLLAIFGFRGAGRTALIGMAAGVLTILAWKKWVEPITKIDGSFVCMLANGLAMMAAHYLLPQPEGSGWVDLDDEFKQGRQAKTRKTTRQKEELKSLFTKENLATIKPNNTTLIWVGIYITVTSLLALSTMETRKWLMSWLMLQIVVGSSFVGYAVFLKYVDCLKKQTIDWIVGTAWLIGLIFCLPINVIGQLGHVTNPLFTETLVLAHLAVALWILPLDLGLLVTIPLIVIYFICFIKALMCWPSGFVPLYLLALRLLIFSIIIYAKRKITAYVNENTYLRNQQKLRKEQKLKNIAYSLNILPSTTRNELQEDGTILEKVAENVTQSVSFIDEDTPLSKEDFQSIINKFSEWARFLKKQAKSRDHMLLQPTEITLDALINKLEVALEREAGRVPRLLIEKIEQGNTIPTKIVCDVNQAIYLLATAVLHIADLEHIETQLIKIKLQTTHLQYEQSDPNDGAYPLVFPAIAIVISNTTATPEILPTVQSIYMENMEDKEPKQHSNKVGTARIGLIKKTIEYIIHAHYGTLEMTNQNAMLLVLPWNATHIQDKMISKLPMECLTAEVPITLREQHDSITALMGCGDGICQSAAVDSAIIAETMLLLRRCYGFKRHPSGQLFYVRAAQIAQVVAKWIPHSPKPIYAALLYDAVRYTRLPISYIKANYNPGVLGFVENVLKVDQHQEMEQALLQINNRFKEAINKKKLSVLYIKLAERLYDLHQACGYANLEEVKYMAQETLTVDIKLAKQYLEPEIAAALETAAQQALEACRGKG